MLYAGFFIMGLSQGLVEGVINPLVATLYSTEKTRKLNMLHAWWPGGMIIGGLLAYVLTGAGASWQLKLSLILVPAAIYLVMAITETYPKTERVASSVSTGAMWREAGQPLFLLLFVCMWLTAAVELGPDQWFPSVMGSLTGIQGILFLVYTAGLMFILRTYFAGVAHKSPIGTLTVSAALAAVGLYWLGSLQPGASPVVAFAAATIFGVGKTYFWPTMLGVTAERFPRGGALLLSLMGGAGMLSVAVVLPLMGERIDRLGAGAALQFVAGLAVVLVAVFGGLLSLFPRARRLSAGHTGGHAVRGTVPRSGRGGPDVLHSEKPSRERSRPIRGRNPIALDFVGRLHVTACGWRFASRDAIQLEFTRARRICCSTRERTVSGS